MNSEYLAIGEIVGSFGIKGACKVYPLTNDPELLLEIDCFYKLVDGKFEPINLKSIRKHKNILVAELEQIDSIEDMLPLKGQQLYVEKNKLPDLEEDEHYFYELEGCAVITDTGRRLGVLSSIMETGAHPIYVVKSEDHQEFLIPAVPEIVLKKNLEEKNILVHLIPGLVDEDEN